MPVTFTDREAAALEALLADTFAQAVGETVLRDHGFKDAEAARVIKAIAEKLGIDLATDLRGDR
jgi:hypothetical protein